MLEGRCQCGAVHYRLTQRPFAVHCCHCRDCQRETGTAFALNALIESEFLALTHGTTECVETPSNSGKGQKVHRCPTCRVALWSHYGGMGDAASFVRVGTLLEPDDCPPQVHIFTRSKQPWVTLAGPVPQHDIFYSRDELEELFGDEGARRWRALRG